MATSENNSTCEARHLLEGDSRSFGRRESPAAFEIPRRTKRQRTPAVQDAVAAAEVILPGKCPRREWLRPTIRTAFLLAFLAVTALPVIAQTPLSNLVFTVGTTIRDTGGNDWSYVLIGSPQAQLLSGKRFAVYGKPGQPADPGTFSLRGTIYQQTVPTTINLLLNQSVALGQDLNALGQELDTLFHNVSGFASLPLPRKVSTAFQMATTDPASAQALLLLSRLNPGLTLCVGQAFSEQIATATTYEVREVNPATGAAGDVIGRVTITPGAPVVLPAPGYPFQVVTNDPRDHLVIRLRWGTPPELRRLSLLQFGFDVWRIPLAAATAGGFDVTPPTVAQLMNNTNFSRVNQALVMATKDYTTGHGAGAADDPADRTTFFFTDNNGRSLGSVNFPSNSPPHLGYLNPPFADGAQFYYFIAARDVLGRDGFVSAGGLATACRRLRPQAPTDLRVFNTVQVQPLGGGLTTNQERLMLTWQQNTATNDLVTEYWVYRWSNPTMALANDAAPLDHRIAVVAQIAGTNNSFVDDGPASPATPGPTNFWYTVRAVSQAACDPLLSPNCAPAWGVLRQRAGPAATTGDVIGSCGTPVVMFQNYNTNSATPDIFHWRYRFTCQRRDPGIAWVEFFATNTVGAVETLGPLYFPPDGDQIQADYTLTVTSTNYLATAGCIAGTFYGQGSQLATAPFVSPPATNQQLEADFDAGQLLLTALSAGDPLLAAINGGQSYCVPAFGVAAYPDGMVQMQFDVQRGTPMFIQVETNAAGTVPQWTGIAVVTPDTNGIYWLYYPDCLLGPLPPLRGCTVNLPGETDCSQHVARAGDTGPVAPIRVRFRLTPRTHEYRVYRSVNDGPLSLVAQGGSVFDPANPGKTITRTDDAMPPTAARICYFVQLLDENGNGSPMALIGCKDVKPAKLPRPVLAEPQDAGSTNSPQVALNWFCPTSGVFRFEINIERADQPQSTQPSGLTSIKLTRLVTYNSNARYYGLMSEGLVLAHFSEAQLTPPVGVNFGPGPQFTLTANVLPGVPYHISVSAMDAQGNAAEPSQVWSFVWKSPVVLPTVPWPARPLPPVKDFDEDQNVFVLLPFHPRVHAVLMRTSDGLLDYRYPVGIRIGQMPSTAIFSENVGSTNLAMYSLAAPFAALRLPAPPADPHTLIFRRQSQDPTRRGDLLLPIVVYRMQVTNSAFPRVSGALTQVTPLLEQLAYQTNLCANCNTPTTDVTIYDRLIAIGYESAPLFDTQGAFLYLRDQQPVILGATYAYFVVRLNDQREISEVIPAGEVTIPSQ